MSLVSSRPSRQSSLSARNTIHQRPSNIKSRLLKILTGYIGSVSGLCHIMCIVFNFSRSALHLYSNHRTKHCKMITNTQQTAEAWPLHCVLHVGGIANNYNLTNLRLNELFKLFSYIWFPEAYHLSTYQQTCKQCFTMYGCRISSPFTTIICSWRCLSGFFLNRCTVAYMCWSWLAAHATFPFFPKHVPISGEGAPVVWWLAGGG